jgi:hypothetical protein
MSEPFEYRGYNVPGAKNLCISRAKGNGQGDLLPRLSLILDLVAQIEDQFPVLPSEVLIGRFD